ncbi:hypothetical protein CFR73_15055 [Novacetimonas maltaceti]|nr:hypothetical protein CFR73_15055 [Novacetimonas maltaceti]
MYPTNSLLGIDASMSRRSQPFPQVICTCTNQAAEVKAGKLSGLKPATDLAWVQTEEFSDFVRAIQQFRSLI